MGMYVAEITPVIERGFACFIPLVLEAVQAGFPSPASDYMDGGIDLNAHLIPHPASTFIVRVRGNSMQDAGINDGDELIVDKSLSAKSGNIVVAVVDGEFTVKRLRLTPAKSFLEPANCDYQNISLHDKEWMIWGVVTRILHYPSE